MDLDPWNMSDDESPSWSQLIEDYNFVIRGIFRCVIQINTNLGVEEYHAKLASEGPELREFNNRWMVKTCKLGVYLQFWLRPILTQHEFFRLGPLAFRSVCAHRLRIFSNQRRVTDLNESQVCPFA
jgi:hypothetical protein